MWPMIPMFRVRTSGSSRLTRLLPAPRWEPSGLPVFSTVSDTSTFSAGVAMPIDPPHEKPGPGRARPRAAPRSPSVVRERSVRLRHLVHVLAPLDRDALPGGGVHDLAHQAVRHRVLLARARVVHEPPQRERGAAGRAYLDRDLV